MTLVVKDGNTTPQALGTLPTAAGELAVVHTQAASVNGVATPISNAYPLPVMLTSGAVAADGSSTIAAGGVAQNLFSGTTPTNGYLVANLNPSGGRVLYISDIGTASAAGSSIPIQPQEEWRTPPGYKPPAAVSIFGTTTSDPFAARRW
jgi:hypothetical protein